MRVKKGFILREVAGEKVLVAVGPVPEGNPYLVFLTESAALLWDTLQDGFSVEQLVNETVGNYPNVDTDEVKSDIVEFVEFLRLSRILDE